MFFFLRIILNITYNIYIYMFICAILHYVVPLKRIRLKICFRFKIYKTFWIINLVPKEI